MESRKQRLLKQAQQAREVGNLYIGEAGEKAIGAIYHLGKAALSGNVISDAIDGWRGGYKIGEGFEYFKEGCKHYSEANKLENKASQSKWWHF